MSRPSRGTCAALLAALPRLARRSSHGGAWRSSGSALVSAARVEQPQPPKDKPPCSRFMGCSGLEEARKLSQPAAAKREEPLPHHWVDFPDAGAQKGGSDDSGVLRQEHLRQHWLDFPDKPPAAADDASPRKAEAPPKTTTEAPEATTEAPKTTEAPETTTEAPKATTEAPKTTTEAPETTTEAPKTTTEAPTEAPEAITTAPRVNWLHAPTREAATEAPKATTEERQATTSEEWRAADGLETTTLAELETTTDEGDASERSAQQLLGLERKASVWLTTPDPMYRMAKRPDLYFEDQTEILSANGAVTVSISGRGGQTIEGFGGTFTDAAGDLFDRLDEAQQDTIMEAYFGETGIGYTLGKVPINSNDFSTETYSFDDEANDMDLEHFDHDVSHDAKSIIPMILAAQKRLADTEQEDMHLVAVPWSPPGWMKTNGHMQGSEEHCLGDKMASVWASYMSMWISAYVGKGVPIWAVTPQNDPDPARDKDWETCRYSPEEEAEFIAKHLGPKLKETHPHVKILAFDGNKESIVDWANATLNHSASVNYVSGLAFQWFAGDKFGLVGNMHRELPDAILLSSSAAYSMPHDLKGYRHGHAFFASGDWHRGEGYAHDIIGDLNAGTSAWIDGSLLLNSAGGPNRKGHLMDAPIMIDEGRLSFHPQYYFTGHLSKFILRGSVLLKTVVLRNVGRGRSAEQGFGHCDGNDGLQVVAARRPDQKVALVVLNCGDKPQGYSIAFVGSVGRTEIPPHAIQTYLIDEEAFKVKPSTRLGEHTVAATEGALTGVMAPARRALDGAPPGWAGVAQKRAEAAPAHGLAAWAAVAVDLAAVASLLLAAAVGAALLLRERPPPRTAWWPGPPCRSAWPRCLR